MFTRAVLDKVHNIANPATAINSLSFRTKSDLVVALQQPADKVLPCFRHSETSKRSTHAGDR
jgi:hypothetical protein